MVELPLLQQKSSIKTLQYYNDRCSNESLSYYIHKCFIITKYTLVRVGKSFMSSLWSNFVTATFFCLFIDEPSGSSEASSVGMSPSARRRLDTGFHSTESKQLLDYLRKTQQAQLDLLCVRVRWTSGKDVFRVMNGLVFLVQMNRFFQPALSLLLDLRLPNCNISRRLDPVTSFLQRHRHSLKKYLYPQCFDTLMGMFWAQILKVDALFVNLFLL